MEIAVPEALDAELFEGVLMEIIVGEGAVDCPNV